MSSALGLAVASTAPPAAAPLGEALRMMPWGRPGSPWDTGAATFRTPDGRIWPYDPAGSHRTMIVDLFVAPRRLRQVGARQLHPTGAVRVLCGTRPNRGQAAADRQAGRRPLGRGLHPAAGRGAAAGAPQRGDLRRHAADRWLRGQHLRYPGRLPRAAAARTGLHPELPGPRDHADRRRGPLRGHGPADRLRGGRGIPHGRGQRPEHPAEDLSARHPARDR